MSIGSASDVRALYVHVPFCERKCEYCDFMSVAGKRAEREYSGALQGEIRMLGERCPGITLDTVFFGGGTPSFIDPELLAGILREVRSAFRVDRNAEVTLEANPSSTDRGRAAAWLEAGFNRVSIGVQSLEADALRFLGRVHDARRALSAIGEVRDAGFSAVNCDLIYAVPRLGDARWRRTLQRVIAAAPDHVSCYELTVEAGTPLHVSVARGAVTPVAGWRALRQHRIAVDELAAAGYAQYEVSNFARRDARCRHNLVYWTGGHYLAAGVAAHGHLPASVALTAGVVDHTADAASVRYWHGRGIAAYIAAIDAGDLPVHGVELITAATRERERLMLGLRLRDGVSIDDARARSAAELLMDRGLLEAAGTRVRTTARGEAVLNQVALMLTEDLAA